MKRTIIAILLLASCMATYQAIKADRRDNEPRYDYSTRYNYSRGKVWVGKQCLDGLENIFNRTEYMFDLRFITPRELQALQGSIFAKFLTPGQQKTIVYIVDLIKSAQRDMNKSATHQTAEKERAMAHHRLFELISALGLELEIIIENQCNAQHR